MSDSETGRRVAVSRSGRGGDCVRGTECQLGRQGVLRMAHTVFDEGAKDPSSMGREVHRDWTPDTPPGNPAGDVCCGQCPTADSTVLKSCCNTVASDYQPVPSFNSAPCKLPAS